MQPKSNLSFCNMSFISRFHPLSRLQRQRDNYLKLQYPPDFLAEVLACQLPSISDDISKHDYIILDFETTGLDPKTDRILSFGWVEMSGKYINLSTATEIYINDVCQIKKETAVINHIMPEMLSSGSSLDKAMMQFFQQAKNKIIIAHGCVVEKRFIDHYFNQRFNLPAVPLIWLDTLKIERYLVSAESSSDYRLSSTRIRYGLPEYNAHNALTDSIATAELFQALFKRLSMREKALFGKIYKISNRL